MLGLRGIYRHIKNQQLYFVDGIARDVANPNRLAVIYTQLYDSQLRTSSKVEQPINLPKGSMWMRNIDDFNKKFEKLSQTQVEKFTTTITTALEKDILYGYNKKDKEAPSRELEERGSGMFY